MNQTWDVTGPAVKGIEDAFGSGAGGEIYVSVAEPDFLDTMALLAARDVVLIGLFAAEDFDGRGGFTLFYVLEKRDCRNLVVVQRRLAGDEATSVARLFPSACWCEREIRDGFGIEFPNAFDQRRLFLHEVYPDGFHPLRKGFLNRPVDTSGEISSDREYRFKQVAGEGVYEIPVGPVHAGIIEPGHFRFSVIGETIFNLEVRMFFKHRGIEKLAEGKTPEQCVAIAESISGDESAANAVAFSTAVEKVCETSVPVRAWHLRTVLLEMERIYSHLGDLAGMIVDVAFPKGASRFFVLREEVLRQNAALTGSRFMRGIVCPGGLKRDITAEALAGLSEYLARFLPRFEEALELVHSTSSVVDRLETAGVIRRELVNPLNITGPAARAVGVAIDTRRDHPYGIYGSLAPEKRTADKGDVMARFQVKSNEVLDSVAAIRDLAGRVPLGPVLVMPQMKDGYALALVEAARGQSLHWVNIRNGFVDRYKVRTASFCNWQAIEHAVLRDIVPDFPLVNKSLNLSYAGTDL